MFLPEDVALVGGPPAERRRHLDDLLSQLYPEYVEDLSKYQSALSRCNALLRHLQDHRGDRAQLGPLEVTLAQTVSVCLCPAGGCSPSSPSTRIVSPGTDGGKRMAAVALSAEFRSAAAPALNYQLGLLPQEISAAPADVETLEHAYLETLVKTRQKAIQRGAVLMGPHRDEVRFLSGGVDLGTFGSRGQQRTAVLALRLAELHWLRQETGESPVLLLDEVLAELDRERRSYLLGLLGGVEQSILATTDAEMFPEAFRQKTLTFEVAGGIVTPLSS
jgi:DNA replication and repair protein RecF